MTIFRVKGIPAPQGSKRAYVNKTGRVSLVESSKAVKPWRDAVKSAYMAGKHGLHTGPVSIEILFLFARPKGHYRSGRNDHILRDSAPSWPSVRPDLDKLIRSTLDALTDAGAIEDDARVVNIGAAKEYAGRGIEPGAVIDITQHIHAEYGPDCGA